jgi:hypothetical protein
MLTLVGDLTADRESAVNAVHPRLLWSTVRLTGVPHVSHTGWLGLSEKHFQPDFSFLENIKQVLKFGNS